MLFLRMPIRWKITILSFGVVLFSLLIGGIILIGNLVNQKEAELEKRALITARTVAQLPEIKHQLLVAEGWKNINQVIEQIRIINNIDYIVVLNMDRIRYSHPVEDKLGSKSMGEDEGPAFAEHTYTSKAKGDIGVAIRAFVPVMNENFEQIGVVVAGNLMPGVSDFIFGLKQEISIIVFLTLFFGIMGSWMLAKHIKEQTFKLEPHEIAHMLEERTATFNAMHEGVIAVNNQRIITIFNEKAKQMLGIHGEVIGKEITEVIPDTRLPEILKSEITVFNEEIQIGQTNIMSSRVPIEYQGFTVGAVAIFQDRSEVTKVAEELTGVKAFVEALRIQNHEHLNKLHTIAGLIQLGHQEQALNYVFKVYEEHKELSKFVSKNIRDKNIAGLLLSKVSRGKELDIRVEIDTKSRLNSFPEGLDQHDFVLILGNLIENAFTALKQVNRDMKQVDISMDQDKELCSVMVEDNGCGISPEEQDIIFEEGFTTKPDGSGLGLYLVNRIVGKAGGTIEVESDSEGSRFIVTFPMKQGGQSSGE